VVRSCTGRPTVGLVPPTTFAQPPGLDDKGVRDWGKIADKVHDGDLAEALHKLRDFERKRGGSAETERLRTWLENQALHPRPGDLD